MRHLTFDFEFPRALDQNLIEREYFTRPMVKCNCEMQSVACPQPQFESFEEPARLREVCSLRDEYREALI